MNTIVNYTPSPVFVDGAIYVAIAIFGAVASALGSDDAAKYIAPATLWWMKNISTAFAAGMLALKMYRSTAYSTYLTEKKNGNTEFLNKPGAPTQ